MPQVKSLNTSEVFLEECFIQCHKQEESNKKMNANIKES